MGFIVTNYNDAPNGTENLQLGTYPDEKLSDATTTTASTIHIISVESNGDVDLSDNNQS
jgi:deoxycytidylate deaminase